MLKKIKEFLFGTKPTPEPVPAPTPAPSVDWENAAKLKAAIEAVASAKIVKTTTTTTMEPPAAVEVQKPTKKKRTFVKREPKAEAPSTWPFPVEKPSEGVTPAELEALTAPAAMKVQRKRKTKAAKPE